MEQFVLKGWVRILVAMTLVALVSSPALTQATGGEIRGVVKDQTSGEPLVGANIILEGTNRGTSTQAIVPHEVLLAVRKERSAIRTSGENVWTRLVKRKVLTKVQYSFLWTSETQCLFELKFVKSGVKVKSKVGNWPGNEKRMRAHCNP